MSAFAGFKMRALAGKLHWTLVSIHERGAAKKKRVGPKPHPFSEIPARRSSLEVELRDELHCPRVTHRVRDLAEARRVGEVAAGEAEVRVVERVERLHLQGQE